MLRWKLRRSVLCIAAWMVVIFEVARFWKAIDNYKSNKILTKETAQLRNDYNVLFDHCPFNQKVDTAHSHIIHLSDGSLLRPLKADWIKDVPWHKAITDRNGYYDILAVHHVWNKEADEVLLGPTRKVRITILRNPAQAYESIFNGFRYNRIVQTSFADFVKQIYVSPSLYRYRFGKLGLGLNQQIAMFGLVGDNSYNPVLVQKTIDEIEENFDLVMIMEKMDESLVLLSDLMCWPLQKVASLLINGRQIERRYDVSPDEENKLKTWQWPDQEPKNINYAITDGGPL